MPNIILRKNKDLPALKPKAVSSSVDFACKKEPYSGPRGWNVAETLNYAGKALRQAYDLKAAEFEEQRHKESHKNYQYAINY